MSLLQGAFWISDQQYGQYLCADTDGSVKATTQGSRGLDLLNSTEPRPRIWLIEKATDGKNFRFRNYETGTALDIKDQRSDDGTRIVVTSGNRESQIWEVDWFETSPLGGIYKINNTLTSKSLSLTDNSRQNSWTHKVVSYRPHGGQSEAWLIEPVLLPTLYWLTNLAIPTLVLRAPDRPYASDNTSGGVALVPKKAGVRNQLWTFEYTSVHESILRSASLDQFVLDLDAQDSQTLLACKHNSGSSQRWIVKDDPENKNNQVITLANAKTNTLLAARKQPLSGGRMLDTLATVLEGNIHWHIYPSPQPPFFWVTIQNLQTGAFLAQARDGSIIPSIGALHANDHTVQWRFILLGKDPRYVIVNRGTGFMLEYRAGATSEVSVIAESDDRNGVNRHWMLDSAGSTDVSIVNVASQCVLDHYCGETIQACDLHTGYNYSYRQWVIVPFCDALPSFALVNSHTGRCIANSPNPDTGTVAITDNINDFSSQWLFYHSVNSIETDPECVLLNKKSGNVLEHYKGTRIDAHDVSCADPQQKWKLLPLRERGFALVNAATQQFLYDPGESSPRTGDMLPDDNQTLCWQFISHRESGFDFISLDFDILQLLLPYLSSQSAQELQHVMTRWSAAGGKTRKGNDKSAYIPRTSRIARTTNDTLRAILTRLIGQWEDDSIPETSQPHTMASTSISDVEKKWGISVSERSLRRRSDESGWVRIDLQGMHNIDSSWLANIQGQWLEVPVFQIIVPAGKQLGRATIQQAMLKSLAEGLTIEVRATPSTPTPTPGKGGSPNTTPRPEGLEDEGRMNSLALTLDSIMISSLKHDEL